MEGAPHPGSCFEHIGEEPVFRANSLPLQEQRPDAPARAEKKGETHARFVQHFVKADSGRDGQDGGASVVTGRDG